jgi:hypothetical protein
MLVLLVAQHILATMDFCNQIVAFISVRKQIVLFKMDILSHEIRIPLSLFHAKSITDILYQM